MCFTSTFYAFQKWTKTVIIHALINRKLNRLLTFTHLSPTLKFWSTVYCSFPVWLLRCIAFSERQKVTYQFLWTRFKNHLKMLSGLNMFIQLLLYCSCHAPIFFVLSLKFTVIFWAPSVSATGLTVIWSHTSV